MNYYDGNVGDFTETDIVKNVEEFSVDPSAFTAKIKHKGVWKDVQFDNGSLIRGYNVFGVEFSADLIENDVVVVTLSVTILVLVWQIED